MSDPATRAAEALEELRAELAHADTLITEQQTRIEKLERHIQFLQYRPNTLGPRKRPFVALRWALITGLGDSARAPKRTNPGE